MKLSESIKKNKRKVVLIAVIAIIVAVAIGSTAAYFTAVGVERNVITSGDIKIELKETMINDQGQEVPYVDPEVVMPGDVISKMPKVTNTGDNPAYIRVKVEKNIQLAEGKQGEVDLSLISLNIDKNNWTEKGGYWYYNKALPKGETTPALFTTVTFKPGMDNLYQGCTVTINIKAYAVQSQNNGKDVMEAKGWPDESDK